MRRREGTPKIAKKLKEEQAEKVLLSGVMGTLRVLAKAPSFRRLTIIFINNSVTPLR